MKIKGYIVKRRNNLQIRYSDLYQYSVWTPNGKMCLEDRFPTLERAEEFCAETTDFSVMAQRKQMKKGVSKSHV